MTKADLTGKKYNYLFEGGSFNLRYIEKSDAEFIIGLRTDKKLGKNLSWTSSNIDEQKKWIEKYKEREAENKEFYFIYEDLEGFRWGTVRLYNLAGESFTIGSWICLPNNKDKIAIKAWLFCVEYGFEKLKYNVCLFDVRKKNVGVLYFAYLFQPTFLYDTELDIFFSVDKETFFKNRERVYKLVYPVAKK